jgi:hypothetical protein
MLLSSACLPAAAAPAQAIFSSGFDFATPALRGGSNLLWYALGPNCDREPYGILPNYHEPGVRAAVRAQLIDLRVSGQERVSIGIFHFTPSTPTLDGRVTGTQLDSSGGALRPQYLQNIRTWSPTCVTPVSRTTCSAGSRRARTTPSCGRRWMRPVWRTTGA